MKYSKYIFLASLFCIPAGNTSFENIFLFLFHPSLTHTFSSLNWGEKVPSSNKEQGRHIIRKNRMSILFGRFLQFPLIDPSITLIIIISNRSLYYFSINQSNNIINIMFWFWVGFVLLLLLLLFCCCLFLVLFLS